MAADMPCTFLPVMEELQNAPFSHADELSVRLTMEGDILARHLRECLLSDEGGPSKDALALVRKLCARHSLSPARMSICRTTYLLHRHPEGTKDIASVVDAEDPAPSGSGGATGSADPLPTVQDCHIPV